ncbi:hypothetical protein MRS76_24405 [Rhizobiaceae bacterium n13]|uniref:hypothetical protein n=1 Tax=Ferirhizobium litorale TaxID=2927786 RepID=UPI0024B2EB18|nr:hypothetical protein [Fererhizobium litorale]MDI7865063.1 hypothetical protein [Fererhizobium litorale]
MTSRTELAAVWPPTAAIAKTAGHKPMSPMKAIREKCLDCCVGQHSEIRLCEAVKCSLWPFRSGSHPYTASKTKNPLQEADYQESEGINVKGPVESPQLAEPSSTLTPHKDQRNEHRNQ